MSVIKKIDVVEDFWLTRAPNRTFYPDNPELRESVGYALAHNILGSRTMGLLDIDWFSCLNPECVSLYVNYTSNHGDVRVRHLDIYKILNEFLKVDPQMRDTIISSVSISNWIKRFFCYLLVEDI